LYPDERRLGIEGLYRLRNKTTSTITAVYVTQSPEAKVRALAVGVVANPTERDDELGFYRFDLPQPLAPKAETELRFAIEYRNPGFRNGHFADRIAGNG